MEPETSQGESSPESSPERSHAPQPQSSQGEAAGTVTARDPVPQDKQLLLTTVWPLLIKKKPPSRHQTARPSGATHRGKPLRQASAASVHGRPETSKTGETEDPRSLQSQHRLRHRPAAPPPRLASQTAPAEPLPPPSKMAPRRRV